MRVAIIGGGITGLTAGYQLVKVGHQVSIFEKENYLGGLASGFKRKNWKWNLEHFYHHFFTTDKALKNLIKELGLSQDFFYLQPKTSVFKAGTISRFDSPLSVLQFPHLSPSERLRVGLVTAYLKLKTSPRWCCACGTPRRWKFEEITAENWLIKSYGKKSYQLLWQPLLEAKFGQYASRVSMIWFWARIKKRSSKLGYFKGGFQILVNKLAEKIKRKKGKIFLNHEIKNLNELNNFDKIILTISTPKLFKIASLSTSYQKKLSRLNFVGALNLILVLKEKFLTDGTYWLNINEKEFPFVAVVEHTNLVNKKYYGNNHLLYVGGYYSSHHPYFKMNKEEIFKEFLPCLKKINSSLNVKYYILNTNLFAQPVISVNYSKIMPPMETPIKNVYLANQSLVYPWDRGVNYAIKLGEEISKLI